ncbi:hypothetical protein QWY16_12545 [Planococcus shenhongbingii]|uniref:hypothetical protein n=1 Tax=Planococcus shenhongbingii TaxID=3058398 RepID=UPI002626B175|nr:hypothetical protein [Planococcus sp. N016]WKA57327.1 hypothetical protein QWY16_12545 [Planococcus sp. N016]
MAYLAIRDKTEATSRGWPPELANKKSGSGRSAPKGIRRIGEAAIFAAQPRRLMTRGVGRCSWTIRKAEAAVQL